jgi:UMF1 family MFS transporter
LAVLIGLPFPIMMLVDVERGRAEGIALARELEDLDKMHEERRGGVTTREFIDEIEEEQRR